MEPSDYCGESWLFKTSFIGGWIEGQLERLSPNKKYACEMICRTPMVLFIHLWFLLAPYSDGFWTDIFFLGIRIWVAGIMVENTEFGKVNLMSAYTALMVDMAVAWFTETSFNSIPDTASNCTTIDCIISADNGDVLWTYNRVICLQIIYMLYLTFRYNMHTNVVLITGILIFNCICFVLYVYVDINSLGYGIYKTILICALLSQLLHRMKNDNRYNQYRALCNNCKYGLLTGKWIVRDTLAFFVTFYFTVASLVDIASGQFMPIGSLSHFLSKWTSSYVILFSIGAYLAISSNFAICFTNYVMKGKMVVKESFESQVGNFVNFWMLNTCVQAGMISTQRLENTEPLSFVLLLAVFAILCQMYLTTERYLVQLAAFSNSRNFISTLRVIGLMYIIALGPTSCMYYLLWPTTDSFWPLLNISGMFMVLCRAIVTSTEYILLSLSNSFGERFVKPEIINVIRMFKSFVTVVCFILLSYYKFNHALIAGPVIVKYMVAIYDCLVGVSIEIFIGELNL